MVDVHGPHAPIQGWRDLFVHLAIITAGILIALFLDGCVEWLQHRHLVHEAQASLHREISHNLKAIEAFSADLHQRQKDLDTDMTVLRYLVKNGKMPDNKKMSIGYRISTMDDVSWRTAQATGAVAYMSYAEAGVYADIYAEQEALYAAEKDGARDAIISYAPFMGPQDPDSELTPAQGADLLQKIQILAGQLKLIEALEDNLGKLYQKYLGIQPPGAGAAKDPG